MSTKRNMCAAAVAGDGIYVMGGSDNKGNTHSSAEALRQKKLNAVERVKRIEAELSLTSVQPTILNRINYLEEQMFGESKNGTGSLNDRISNLEKEFGLD